MMAQRCLSMLILLVSLVVTEMVKDGITVLVTQDTALLCLVPPVVKKDAVVKLDVVIADILKLSINKT